MYCIIWNKFRTRTNLERINRVPGGRCRHHRRRPCPTPGDALYQSGSRATATIDADDEEGIGGRRRRVGGGVRIRLVVSHQCVRGGEGGAGGAATKNMTTTEMRSMETRSMGKSSSGAQRRGMARRLAWSVIIGRSVGARCCGGVKVGERSALMGAVTFPLF